MTRNEAIKQLMLGLVYPAVLGTVLYAVLGTALAPLLALLLGKSTVPLVPLLKVVLLVTTVLFYCFDYLYIMFTREFRPLFFVFDLTLLVGLYVTFSMIDTGAPTMPHRNLIIV